MSVSLTPRQSAALDFIRSYMAAHGGRAPSCAEIAAGLGLGSKSNSVRLLNGLVERGRLRRIPNRTRALELVDAAPSNKSWPERTANIATLGDQDLRALAGWIEAELQRRAGA